MQTKLTLRIDEALIEKAKRYGHAHGKSVSQLVAAYFALLDRTEPDGESGLPPLAAALRGVAAGCGLDERDYREHLVRKHLG